MSQLINVPADFRADVELWSSDRSRRTQPLLAGFRGLVRFCGSDEYLDVEVVPRAEALLPGHRGVVEVRFLFRDTEQVVATGRGFSLREGATEIGRGAVL